MARDFFALAVRNARDEFATTPDLRFPESSEERQERETRERNEAGVRRQIQDYLDQLEARR